MSTLDKKYDEPVEKKPVVYTAEEVTEKLRSSNRSIVLTLILLALVIIAMVIGFFRFNTPQTIKVVHPNATDSLRVEVASLRDTLSYLRAHTDTTGMGDMRDRVGYLTNLVESLHGRYDQLQIEFNRHAINTPHQ